jgi:hypothetical protein
MAKQTLHKALRSKIGRWCWFRKEDGGIVEGVYTRGRKVKETTGMKRFTLEEIKAAGPNTVSGFNIEETTWKVPGHIKITFGSAPAEVKR